MSAKHLWDYDHPYYATQGSYFANGYHEDYDTWAEFIDAEGGSDLDLNLLYRWDWKVPDPADYEHDDELPLEHVELFFVHQRKAATRSASVSVTRDDEPAVRAYLIKRADHMCLVWAPLLPGGAS